MSVVARRPKQQVQEGDNSHAQVCCSRCPDCRLYPASFAAKEFYIVRGPDKKCMVVDVAPVTTETKIEKIGKDVYISREDAEADLAVVCKPM